MIGGADLIAVAVSQGALDGIGVPLAAFVQQGGGHRQEIVGGHFVGGVAEAALERVKGIEPSS